MSGRIEKWNVKEESKPNWSKEPDQKIEKRE